MEVRENKVWYLKRSRLFERVSDETVALQEHLFTQVMYWTRKEIFDQGEIGRLVFLIKSGKVKIGRRTEDGKEIVVAILVPGDIFGEEVMFSRPVRTTFAVALEPTLLCTARSEDLYGLLMRHPVLALNAAKYYREQRDEATSLCEDLAYLKVHERVLRLFQKLATKFGIATSTGTLIDVRLTQAEIAGLVGSTRETISVEIGRLVRDGFIEVREGRIVVLSAVHA